MHIEAISTPATIVFGSLIFVFVTHMQNPTISGIGIPFYAIELFTRNAG